MSSIKKLAVPNVKFACLPQAEIADLIKNQISGSLRVRSCNITFQKDRGANLLFFN